MKQQRLFTTACVAAAALLVGTMDREPASAACCYFAAKDKDINQPGQKAFINWNPAEKVEAFTVQPKFEGNALDFGMVIPTPAQPKLDEMPRDFFKDLAIYTILMPLPQQIWGLGDMFEAAFDGRADDRSATVTAREPDSGVVVLESGVVGSLDYKIIVANEANRLFDWLKANSYVYSGDRATLDFYIQKKWFFTVTKIDPKQMKKAGDGSYSGEVTPTRFTFKSDSCIYPLKITQLSVKDQTDALFYVQAPQQMDLSGDLSWQNSYRVMYLTYMLGCAANDQQQKELEQRNQWITARKRRNPTFETTKLEWARQLGDGEISVLEDPLKNYAQGGIGDLPPNATVISHEDFLKEMKAQAEKNLGEYKKTPEYAKDPKVYDEHFKETAKFIEQDYPENKGAVVKIVNRAGAKDAPPQYMWYANREVPAEDIKGLSRLKGHLQKGQWLTKFRKILRKDEMGDDLELVPVAQGQEQTYLRIMPTSPP